MKRIKLNERQILMLKNLERGVSDKNKVLRISESQYNRLFNNKGNAAKDLSKSFNKVFLKVSYLTWLKNKGY